MSPTPTTPTASPRSQVPSLFLKKPPISCNIATHARHKCWHNFQSPCVTLCHLQICSTCAQSTRRLAVWRRTTSSAAPCRCPCIPPRLLGHPAPQAPSLRSQAYFTKNHPNRETPQHKTAARVASVNQNFFRLLSPRDPAPPLTISTFPPTFRNHRGPTGGENRSGIQLKK